MSFTFVNGSLNFVFYNLWGHTNNCLFYHFSFVFRGFLSSSQQNGIHLAVCTSCDNSID